MKPFYICVEDVFDEHGEVVESLDQFCFSSFEEAKAKYESTPCLCHIDYYDENGNRHYSLHGPYQKVMQKIKTVKEFISVLKDQDENSIVMFKEDDGQLLLCTFDYDRFVHHFSVIKMDAELISAVDELINARKKVKQDLTR